jgi:hypothetical protein
MDQTSRPLWASRWLTRMAAVSPGVDDQILIPSRGPGASPGRGQAVSARIGRFISAESASCTDTPSYSTR